MKELAPNADYEGVIKRTVVWGTWHCGYTNLQWEGDISDHHGIEPYCPGPHRRVSPNGSSVPRPGDHRLCSAYGHSLPGRCPNCGMTLPPIGSLETP